MEVSIIIPVKRASPFLLDQLTALSRQIDAPSTEVIVAANGSPSQVNAVVGAARAYLPNLRVVDASSRRGVSYARNAGSHYALGSKLLFCDADDVVDRHWVRALSAALDVYELVGGHIDIINLNDAVTRLWYGGADSAGLARSMGYLPYATGANMGIRADAYEALGGCDESFLGGHEEVDLAWRAQLCGYRLGYVPDAVVLYRLRETLRGLYRQRYHSGRTYSQLFGRYRPYIQLRTTLRGEAARGFAVALQLLSARDRAAFGYAVFMTGWFVGRTVGGIRYRTLGPDDSEPLAPEETGAKADSRNEID